MERLNAPRDEIERLDGELLRILAERMRVVRTIGSVKGADPAAPLRDEARERDLVELWTREAQAHSLSPYFAGRVLREILNWSRRDQERFLERGPAGASLRLRVGYQGVPACYSDLAITKAFATREIERLERRGFRSFRAAIEALEASEIDYALLPIENTIAGSINEVYDLLTPRRLSIVGEEVWAVEHCLVGLPGARLEDVRLVRSHPVALQQCQRFLDGLVGTTIESHHDTAAAAQAVADEGRPESAAIASEEAARQYGLVVLKRGIADQALNLTRFLLIGREPEAMDPRRPAKTSLCFAVNHRRGALLRCLEACERQGLNLTKLESRPQPATPWEYLFYVDFEGHVDEPRVQAALAELRENTNHLRVLGSYPRRTGELEACAPAARPAGPSEGQAKSAAKNGATKNGAAEGNAKNGGAANGSVPHGSANGLACPNGPARNGIKRVEVKNPNLKLVRLEEHREPTVVKVGPVEIGGARFVLISGPCAVESRTQMLDAAALVKAHGAAMLRGGAFKPRTSPYAFQGLGFEGLDLLAEAGAAYELPIVTEVLRPEDVPGVAAKADVLQIGARNMQNFSLLRAVGAVDRPVLLKRGMSATIEELLLAAEYVMAGGNHRVILCERGIRTFETATRNTLDVSAIPVLKSMTHLPVIVDPSHAAGRRDLVVPLSLAAAAAGADGLIVEAHPRPEEALCDKDQALTGVELDELLRGLAPILAARGLTL